MDEGIVYVLTNEAMPGLVKIGMTTRAEISIRMSELWTTGIPVPFECAFAGKVLDARKVEKAFHIAFAPDRINPSREFFKIDPIQAITLLELMCSENLTPQLNKELDKVDEASKEAGKQLRKKRPRFSFGEMGIPTGSILYATVNDESCEVLNDRDVHFRGEIMSLTNAAKILLGIDYRMAPGPYWTFNGKKIRDIYNETYPFEAN